MDNQTEQELLTLLVEIVNEVKALRTAVEAQAPKKRKPGGGRKKKVVEPEEPEVQLAPEADPVPEPIEYGEIIKALTDVVNRNMGEGASHVVHKKGDELYVDDFCIKREHVQQILPVFNDLTPEQISEQLMIPLAAVQCILCLVSQQQGA